MNGFVYLRSRCLALAYDSSAKGLMVDMSTKLSKGGSTELGVHLSCQAYFLSFYKDWRVFEQLVVNVNGCTQISIKMNERLSRLFKVQFPALPF